ncbi:MAG TPA: hypothetical protein VFS67_16515 [Polyangiaceae bacterium]|nr:hypothetical protein [Polyangiaceae bacterium]
MALDERSRRRKQTMKNDNQAALDLFSSYSDFMLTDDELLAIHGGTTQSGSAGSSPAGAGPAGSSPSAPSAPPPAPPPPQAPVVQVQPVTGHVNVDVGQSATSELAVAVHEITHEIVDIVHDIHTSGPVQAMGDFITSGINAANHALFGGGSGG